MALYKINCQAQNYAWGVAADQSEVAQLSLAAGQEVDTSKPFAELWMGTHPAAPSTLTDNGLVGTELKAVLQQRPELLGAAAAEFGGDLPFLFKVLSVGTALSIQSHPDKALAEKLHADRPQVYKDNNHKPEMALALNDFEALVEFCPHEELAAIFASVPELAQVAGQQLVDAYIGSTPEARKAALRAVFSALMVADAAAVAAAIERMVARLGSEAAAGRELTPKERLALRLNEQYPGDVGVLAAWFLNYVTLSPGQAIWLAPNEPHAYLAGDIVECMATSDNVIRAGLTPKLRDTELLESSLTYNQGPPEVMDGAKAGPHLQLYRPPFREFEIYAFRPPAGSSASLPACQGPLVMLVQHGNAELRGSWGEAQAHGSARSLARGDIYFVGAGTELQFDVEEDMVVWFAAVNGLGFVPPAAAAEAASH